MSLPAGTVPSLPLAKGKVAGTQPTKWFPVLSPGLTLTLTTQAVCPLPPPAEEEEEGDGRWDCRGGSAEVQ